MTMPTITRLDALSPEARAALLIRSEEDLGPYLDGAAQIIAAVRTEGDAALLRFAKDFDGAEIPPGGLRQGPEAFRAAEARLDPGFVRDMAVAVERVQAFHARQKPEPMWRAGGGAGAADPVGRVLCAARQGGLSLHRRHDRGDRAGGRRAADCRALPAHARGRGG